MTYNWFESINILAAAFAVGWAAGLITFAIVRAEAQRRRRRELLGRAHRAIMGYDHDYD